MELEDFERSSEELLHGYEYGATNRLSCAWNGEEEALYQYNGLGQRTGKTENGKEEQYLLDLSRPYHNLLGLTGEGKEQTFYWDGNTAALKEGELHYYLQDELGSPLRIRGTVRKPLPDFSPNTRVYLVGGVYSKGETLELF